MVQWLQYDTASSVNVKMCGARPPTLQHYHDMNVMHRDISIPFWRLCIKYNLTSKHTNSLHDTCVIFTDSPTYNYNEHSLAVCYLNRINTQRIAFLAGFIPSQLPASCLTVAPRADKLEKAVGSNPLLEVNVICEFDISGHITESFEFKSFWLSFRSPRLWIFSVSTRHLVLQNEYNTLTVFGFSAVRWCM